MGDLIKQAAKKCWASKWTKWLTVVAVALLIAAAIAPPLFSIDASILAAVGEILAFGVLINFSYAVENGYKASFKKGDTEVTVDDD